MIKKEAQRLGLKTALKATAVIVIILILLLLFGETRGDFANGILFFLRALFNIHTIAIVTILFGLTYLLGARAGVEIIISKKNFLAVALKYAVIISLSTTAYALIVGLVKPQGIAFNTILKNYSLPLFMKTVFCLLIAWLWATNKLRKMS
jgi:hypothetical protein